MSSRLEGQRFNKSMREQETGLGITKDIQYRRHSEARVDYSKR